MNNEDGTIRPREELGAIYRQAGRTGEKPVITYCRIVERSSHSWFMLTHLLGMEQVENNDASWTEWDNFVGTPIATGPV